MNFIVLYCNNGKKYTKQVLKSTNETLESVYTSSIDFMVFYHGQCVNSQKKEIQVKKIKKTQKKY